ncbi:MAG: thiamine phosphate synthase [Clostridia bacterium]|nr:thiamine phosphate synthase [Clostridia bacterium]
MSDILCVTNRKLCCENFLSRIKKIAAAKPTGIILREKDMSEAEYMKLASDVIEICKRYNTPCILHTFTSAAEKLGCRAIHLPLDVLCTISHADRAKFSVLGASCHSAEDAIKAEKLGCTYITAGHVFNTDCKKGLPGRGLEFLKAVCESVSIPVYAIGGISSENIAEVRKHGADGACVMSGAMMCKDVEKYFGDLK